MSLVAYGSSDDSSEESDNEGSARNPVTEKMAQGALNEDKSDVVDNDRGIALFSALPKPKVQPFPVGDEGKLNHLLLSKGSGSLGAHKKEPVKISVPALSDFDDGPSSEPQAKKSKPSTKTVGLFSILPPPKNLTVKEIKRSLVPNSVIKSQPKLEVKKPTVKQTELFDSDFHVTDSEVQGNFLGIEDTSNPLGGRNNARNSSTSFSDGLASSSDVYLQSSTSQPSTEEYEAEAEQIKTVLAQEEAFDVDQSEGSDSIPVQSNPLELDEKALQILCGGKKKRQQMPMNIIDVSGEEIMPDSKEWLIKQLTTEQKKSKSHSHRKNDGPSTQSRRKHQITYLAFQAKERELELQDQWANNRMSRKQTQSKYGF